MFESDLEMIDERMELDSSDHSADAATAADSGEEAPIRRLKKKKQKKTREGKKKKNDKFHEQGQRQRARQSEPSPPRGTEDEMDNVTRLMRTLSSNDRQVQQEPVSPLLPPRQRRDASIPLFYDDENFAFDDHIARRTVYRAFERGDLPAGRHIRSISCFNFTEKHFDRPGATQWYHLKQEKLDLLCSLFSALAFATGKKERKQPPEKLNKRGGTTGRKKRPPKRGGDDGGGSEAEEANEDPLNGGEPSTAGSTPVDLQYIRGNEHLSLFVETLVQENRVKGFRWWLFDTEPPNQRDSLLCRGLTESLLEAEEIAREAQQQLTALATGGQTRKGIGGGGGGGGSGAATTAAATSVKLKNAELLDAHTVRREYHYTRFTDHNSHFANITKPYFTTDPCLSLGDGNASQVTEKAFRDDRAFMSFDTLTDEQHRFMPFTNWHHPCNFSMLFSKEAAMINYVCDEAIEPAQCRLTSYVDGCESMLLPSDATYRMVDEDDQLLERFNNALRTRCDDENFTGFPLPNVTYQFNNFFAAQDFITRLPLPHRIGAQLYTDVERDELEARLDGGDASRPVDPQRTFYGLHHSECELTSELMLYNPQHLDPETTRAISRTHPTREARLKFMQNKRDEINARLKLIHTNLSLRGRIFICPLIDEQPQMLHENNLQQRAAKKRQIELLDSFSHVMNYTNRSGESAHGAGDMRLLPYLSCSPAGTITQGDRAALLHRLVMQQIRELRPEAKTAEMREEERRYEELYYRRKVASGYPGFFKEEIEKWRPYSNTMDALRTQLKSAGGTLETEETFLRRNVFLRMGELNRFAYQQWTRKYYDRESGQIPEDLMREAMTALRKMQDALMVEFFHEFFSSPDVSMATLGIRQDMLKKPLLFQSHTAATTDEANRRRIGTELPEYDYGMNVRPFAAFIVWINSFLADQGGISIHFKTTMLMYFCRGHNSRWHPECNNPKLNPILCGTGMAGKSKILQLMKKICPSGVGDMVTHITDHAFNVDRDLNDILLIYEEFQNKFLGYSGQTLSKNNGATNSGGGGVSVGSDKDTSNFFKARLTSGRTTTFSWFENEETGKRDVKISHASVQGNMMGASNNDFTDADLNVLSRLILISVPKSRFGTLGKRPSDRTKASAGEDATQDSAVVEQHREVMRVQFMIEKAIQSGVLGNQKYGVEMMSAIPFIHQILDALEQRYGIVTNDPRKREYVIELARLMTVFFAAWIGLTSPLTRYLQKDPFDERVDIGFNPLVLLDGIMPFLVTQKDQVIMALTSLSCLWYHDHQDVILEAFATKKCRLHELRESDFLVRQKSDVDAAGFTSATARLVAASHTDNADGSGSAKKAKKHKHGAVDLVVDYNYIKMTGRNYNEICTSLSNALGDFQVAPSEISRLLWDLGRVPLIVDTYEKVQDPETLQWSLRLSGKAENFAERYIIERSVTDGKATIAILVHFLRKKLPTLLRDARIDEPIDDQLFASRTSPQQQQQPRASLSAEEKISCLGEVDANTRTLIVRAIEDVLQNEILENAHEKRWADLHRHYSDAESGRNPLMRFVIADPPKPVKMTDLYPEMRGWIGQTKTKDQPVVFVDELLMLPLEAKKTGARMILWNYNTLAPSVKRSLSVYSHTSGGGDENRNEQNARLMKNRVAQYTETDAWEVDCDLDSLACAEHMRNTGRRRLTSRPKYTLYNYMPSLYAALMETKSDEDRAALLDYPRCDITNAVAQRKRRLENERYPERAKYAKMSSFVTANYDGKAVDEEYAFIGRPFKRQKQRAVLSQ